MMADCEDLQESDVSEIHIKRFRSKEEFVKGVRISKCKRNS